MSKRLVYVTQWHFIDCLDFMWPAGIAQHHYMAPCSVDEALRVFKEAGWEGDGDLGLIWIPAFMCGPDDHIGCCLWHVKQSNDGTSWLLGRVALRLDFDGTGGEWKTFTVEH